MIKFGKYLEKVDSNLFETIRRTGIAHWAYPDGYIRSHYPAGYFMPSAADALFKMGPKANEKNVHHGQFRYTHHDKMT